MSARVVELPKVLQSYSNIKTFRIQKQNTFWKADIQ